MDSPDEKQAPDVITSDTNNATIIEPTDAPSHKQKKFRRFRAYNTGTWNGPKREETEVRRRQDDLHRYDSIASSLSLTNYQKKRGRKMLDSLDFHTLGGSIDQIIFAVCTVVANADVEDGTRYWPRKNVLKNDDLFGEMAQELGFSFRQQLSLLQKVKTRLDV